MRVGRLAVYRGQRGAAWDAVVRQQECFRRVAAGGDRRQCAVSAESRISEGERSG